MSANQWILQVMYISIASIANSEHLDRVFDRFFSYRPAAPATRHEHVGLGLAIARAIVSECGGTIVARQRDGGGALIDVRLLDAT